MDPASPPSQLLHPTSGAALYELEVARRRNLARRGPLRMGCSELDDALLLGGFERGAVVGVSAEEVEFGVLVGLQTVAHAMAYRNKQRAAIITTLATTAILPTLRDVIRAQVQAKLGPIANQRQDVVNAEVRRCLEQISVSRVFDVEGLWEVLKELEINPSSNDAGVSGGEEGKGKGKGADITLGAVAGEDEPPDPPAAELPEKTDDGVADAPPQSPPQAERMEVADSEDEELSLSPSPPSAREASAPPAPASPPPLPSSPPKRRRPQSPPSALPTTTAASALTNLELNPAYRQKETSHFPDLILITHFSTLLTNLFTRSADNKATAHTTLQRLSSHLRSLARSGGAPLVMLLNTTTLTTFTSTTSSASTPGPATTTNAPPNGPNLTASATGTRPLDPTLRSIFASAPARHIPGGGGRDGRETSSSNSIGSSRRQLKPAFGATFAHFLDLHLLCTRVPRTRADAEAAAAGGLARARYCWVVEVLLDEMGVWEWGDGDGDGKERRWTRRSREQRWAAVDVRAGANLVDAFLGAWREARGKGP